MTAVTFDYAFGREQEFYRAVENNSPAGSALVIVLLAAAGLEADNVLTTKPTLAALLAGTNQEATNTGYSRKILTAADLPPIPAPDTVNHWWQAGLSADPSWPAFANDGTGPLGKLVICYRPSAAAPDTDLIPYTLHDFAVTPTGVTLRAEIDANGYIRVYRG